MIKKHHISNEIHHNPTLSKEDQEKLEQNEVLQYWLLNERIQKLTNIFDFQTEVKNYLIDFYLHGYHNSHLNNQFIHLLSLIDEYIQLYLYESKEEYLEMLNGELTYNSLFNDLKNH